MNVIMIYTMNCLTFGALLFLVASGFSLVFGIMKIPNLAHGSMFMLGAYVGVAALHSGLSFPLAVVLSALVVGAFGFIVERLLLRRLSGNENAQVLATLGLVLILDDLALTIWGGNPLRVAAPEHLRSSIWVLGSAFPAYRVVVFVTALVAAAALWLLIEKTRIGAMLRAGVDDLDMARAIGIPASKLFSSLFAGGACLAGAAGVLAGPILSAYPGMDFDILPLVLIVVILGGMGSLVGAFLGSFIVSALYTFGPVLFPELAYFVLFAPMVAVLALKPSGLLGVSAK